MRNVKGSNLQNQRRHINTLQAMIDANGGWIRLRGYETLYFNGIPNDMSIDLSVVEILCEFISSGWALSCGT